MICLRRRHIQKQLSNCVENKEGVLNIEFSIPILIELTDLEESAKLCNSYGFKLLVLIS